MMKRAFWMGMLAWVFVLPGSGCGGPKSCEDLCAAREACPDIIPGSTSCELQCKAQDALVKAAVCEEQEQSFDECLSEQKDICDATTDCSTEGSKRYACLNAYCSKNPNVDGCGPYTGNP